MRVKKPKPEQKTWIITKPTKDSKTPCSSWSSAAATPQHDQRWLGLSLSAFFVLQ
jgi:hypothetical protein